MLAKALAKTSSKALDDISIVNTEELCVVKDMSLSTSLAMQMNFQMARLLSVPDYTFGIVFGFDIRY